MSNRGYGYVDSDRIVWLRATEIAYLCGVPAALVGIWLKRAYRAGTARRGRFKDVRYYTAIGARPDSAGWVVALFGKNIAAAAAAQRV
jgi:hypothetical protein